MSAIDTSPRLDTTAHSPLDLLAAPRAAGAAVTPAAGPVDLSDPIWTIHHVARVLHLSVDRAREVSYSAGFPAPRAGFSRNLWLRAQVLDWFEALPAGERRTTTSATQVRREAGRGPRLERGATRARRGYTPRIPR